MKTQTIGLGALVGALLVVPMVAVMYFADNWLDFSFAPYDVFDWVARILPGPVITFGIDLMIDSLEMLGLNVAATAKTAEHIQAVMAFGAAGVVSSIIVYSVVGRRPAGSGTRPGPPGGRCPGPAGRDDLGEHVPGLDCPVHSLPVGPWRVLRLGRRHGRHGPQAAAA